MKYSEFNNQKNIKILFNHGVKFKSMDTKNGVTFFIDTDDGYDTYQVYGSTENVIKLQFDNGVNKSYKIDKTLKELLEENGITEIEQPANLEALIDTMFYRFKSGKYQGIMVKDVMNNFPNYIEYIINLNETNEEKSKFWDDVSELYNLYNNDISVREYMAEK